MARMPTCHPARDPTPVRLAEYPSCANPSTTGAIFGLLENAHLLLSELGSELGAEIVGLEHLANLDLRLLVGERDSA